MKVSGKLKLAKFAIAALVVFSICGATNALAVVQYEQDITPDVIFGSGNANGSFTTDRQNGVEIGIRAKIPFVGTLNSNSNGTYSYTLAETDLEPGGDTLKPKRWNFDWSINTDFDDSSGWKLEDLTYEIGLDGDPGPGTNFLVFDPIKVPFADHSIGTNATPNGGGVEAINAAEYANLIANNNVAQNSWRYAFFPIDALAGYNPEVPGNYVVYLLARNGDEVVARTKIQILIGGAEPVGPGVDHFQCYDIDDATKLNPRPEVSLTDQFGSRDNVRVKRKAKSYCTPVDKNGEGIINADNTLTCYKTGKGEDEEVEIAIVNQFGEQEFKLKKPKLLCVPTRQLSPTSGDETPPPGDGGTLPPVGPLPPGGPIF